MKEKLRHIPNTLSVIRILLIPVFIYCLFNVSTFAAGVVLVISGITDLVDGQLARMFNWVTNLGKIFDPLADKLTQFTVSDSFIFYLKEFWIFFIIMIVKDLIMVVAGAKFVKKGIKLECLFEIFG